MPRTLGKKRAASMMTSRWTGKDYSAAANVILITRQPIEDAVHQIALTLTDTDIAYMDMTPAATVW